MKIIFFDGLCPMCHSWVKRIIRWDKKKVFRFSPLESALARDMLIPILPDYILEDTIIYYDDGKVFMRSEAAIRISQMLGFPYQIVTISRILPRSWRDSLYKWVANRRYAYGKRYGSCPLPPLEWRDRFL